MCRSKLKGEPGGMRRGDEGWNRVDGWWMVDGGWIGDGGVAAL